VAGIIMSSESVQGVFDGRKTQTRRVIKEDWWRCLDPDDEDDRAQALKMCPFGAVGDQLWVREAWGTTEGNGHRTVYRADVGTDRWPVPVEVTSETRWGNPRFMPRRLSRLTLELLEVRIQRAQDITADDARAEGFTSAPMPARINGEPGRVAFFDPLSWFVAGWNALNAKRGYGWDANPWVWALTFRVGMRT